MKLSTRLTVVIFFLLSVVFVHAAHPDGERPMCVNITSVDITPENCDQRNGSIAVIHDGTAPFTYTWVGTTANTNQATGLSAGAYTVRIEDNAGCSAETTVVVPETQPPLLGLQSTTPASCQGGGGAEVSSSVPGATASWNSNPPQTGYVLTNVAAGEYTITVTDSVGCTAQLSVQIIAPDAPVLDVTTTPDTCGLGFGTATASVSANGTPPFTFRWTIDSVTTRTGALVTDLRGGTTILVEVTDSDGCSNRLNVDIPSVDSFTLDFSIDSISCFDGEDGRITLQPSPASNDYVYDWVNEVGNGNVADNLSAGIYEVNVSVGNVCRATERILVAEPPEINAQVLVSPSSQCGLNDGQITVDPINTQGNFTVRWDTIGGNSPIRPDTLVADSLYPGIYRYTVEDDAGCQVDNRIIVESDNGVEVEVEVLQEDNCGLGQGIAKANLSGGKGPFRFRWFTVSAQPNDSTPFAFNLFRGNWEVVVSDQDECVNQAFFSVDGNLPLELVDTEVESDYCNLQNGTARAEFTGGSGSYTYRWNTLPVQTTQRAAGLEAGQYRVIITDENGCRDTAQVEIEREVGFSLSIETEQLSCFENRDGEARVNVEGNAYPPYFYEWNTSPVQTGETARNLSEGAYQVQVVDSRNCRRSVGAAIENRDPLVADFTFDPDTAFPVGLDEATFFFRNESRGAETFRWDFGDGVTSDLPSPQRTYTDTGRYFVTLTIFANGDRCSDQKQVGPFIVTPSSDIFIPNAFTPNGDGNNEELYFGGVYNGTFEFNLFDRWGQLVWTATSINDRWDGRYGNGVSAPEGVYTFVLRSVGSDDKERRRTGTITLIR